MLRREVVRVLTHLVEDHHGVVQRVAKNRQEADHRRGRHLETDEGVDAHREDEVVHERDDARDGHAPRAEVHRHDERDQNQEDDKRLRRLLAHFGAEGGPNLRLADVVGRHAVRVCEARRDVARHRELDNADLHANVVLTEDRDPGLLVWRVLRHHVLGELRVGVLHLRYLVDVAASEVDAEVQALDDDDRDAQQQRDRGDGEPHAALGNDRIGALSRVQLVAPFGKA